MEMESFVRTPLLKPRDESTMMKNFRELRFSDPQLQVWLGNRPRNKKARASEVDRQRTARSKIFHKNRSELEREENFNSLIGPVRLRGWQPRTRGLLDIIQDMTRLPRDLAETIYNLIPMRRPRYLKVFPYGPPHKGNPYLTLYGKSYPRELILPRGHNMYVHERATLADRLSDPDASLGQLGLDEPLERKGNIFTFPATWFSHLSRLRSPYLPS